LYGISATVPQAALGPISIHIPTNATPPRATPMGTRKTSKSMTATKPYIPTSISLIVLSLSYVYRLICLLVFNASHQGNNKLVHKHQPQQTKTSYRDKPGWPDDHGIETARIGVHGHCLHGGFERTICQRKT